MAQNFYKQNGSYYLEGSNQKISNLSELANYSKAGGKEIKMPTQAPQGAVAINGAKYNTGELQKSNFDNIQQVGNTLYGIPKVANSLTSTEVKGGTPVIPITESSPEDFSGSIAGNVSYVNSLVNDLNTANTNRTNLESDRTKRMGEIDNYNQQLGNQEADYNANLAKFNYNPTITQLQELNRQMTSMNADFNTSIAREEGRKGMAGSIYGRQALLQRQQAVEIGNMAAMAQALQGNITLAETSAQKAIDIKYGAIADQIANEKQQLEYIYNDLDAADKKRADARLELITERQRVLEEEKTKETEINSVMLSAAQNGADVNTLNKIKNSKTVGEAIEAGREYLLDIKDKNVQVIGETTDEYGNSVKTYGYWDGKQFRTISGGAFNGNVTGSETVATETSNLPNEPVEGTPNWARVLIGSAAEETGVPASLISAVIKQESGFNPNASNVSDKEKSYGLGQINLNAHPEITKAQATDPGFAIKFVANRLKNMIDKYGLYDGVQAYNTPGAIGSQQLIKYADNILSMAGVKKTETVNKGYNDRQLKIAQSMMEPGSTLTLESIKQADRPGVNMALNELKEAAKETGDIYGVMKASAGGAKVDATTVKDLAKFGTAITQLDSLKQDIDAFKAKGGTGAFKGRINEKKFWDADVATIKSKLQGVIPTVARGIFSEVGVLTDADIENYKNTIPNIKTPEEAVDRIYTGLMETIDAKILNTYEAYANAGYDVSGFADTYKALKTKIDTNKTISSNTGKTKNGMGYTIIQ